MNAIAIQYLLSALGVIERLWRELGYAKHVSPAENLKLARMLGAVMLAAGSLIGLATMAFGDLDLF